jgi:hypothetical protein
VKAVIVAVGRGTRITEESRLECRSAFKTPRGLRARCVMSFTTQASHLGLGRRLEFGLGVGD